MAPTATTTVTRPGRVTISLAELLTEIRTVLAEHAAGTGDTQPAVPAGDDSRPTSTAVVDGRIVRTELGPDALHGRRRIVYRDVRPVHTWWPFAHRATVHDARTDEVISTVVRATHRRAALAASRPSWPDFTAYVWDVPDLLDRLRSALIAIQEQGDAWRDDLNRLADPAPERRALADTYEQLADQLGDDWLP